MHLALTGTPSVDCMSAPHRQKVEAGGSPMTEQQGKSQHKLLSIAVFQPGFTSQRSKQHRLLRTGRRVGEESRGPSLVTGLSHHGASRGRPAARVTPAPSVDMWVKPSISPFPPAAGRLHHRAPVGRCAEQAMVMRWMPRGARNGVVCVDTKVALV